MFKAQAAFSGLSVNDLADAKQFYSQTLGLTLASETMGLRFQLPNGGELFLYDKENHQPATFTVLNFVVENIDESVDTLTQLGVKFERYDNTPMPQDEKGVLRGLNAQKGPDIAWFKDPAGNILSLIQDK